MATPPPIITLLTDFGEFDGYVGAMKGVILGILPDVQLIDISHQVPPQDIHRAALILSSVYTYFPAHAVHLVIVDPGVGGERRPIALETPRGRFVAPDNGVLSHVQRREPSHKAILLDNPDYWLPTPSYTFHGRDIFSPVAAHLAQGIPLEEIGTPFDQLTILPLPPLIIAPSSIRGEIIQIDRFGNALTNIMHLSWIEGQILEFQPVNAGPKAEDTVRIDGRTAYVTCGWHTLKGLHQTYDRVSIGQPIALVGSGGELEIAINQGNASESLAIKVGDPVTLHIKP